MKIKEEIMKEFKKNLDKPEVEEQVPVETPPALPSEPIEFEQAFRKFKKVKPESSAWNLSAVEIFAKKRVANEKNSLADWFSVFKQY